MSDLGLLVYAVVALAMSILSGATGGGGGFILTPLMIFLGLSPAQAVANGKFGGISVTIGSLVGLRGHKLSNKRLTALLIVIAVIIGLIVPRIIVTIDPETYKAILGILLMALSPLIVFKKLGHKAMEVTARRKAFGLVAIVASMFMVGIFSSGIGIFINIAMMGFLGMSAIDAAVTKRTSQLFLNVTIVIGLLFSGLFVPKVIIVNSIVNGLGGYIGGKIAMKKGSAFVGGLIAISAFASGLFLVVS